MTGRSELCTGELRLRGRITTASNQTFLGSIGETLVVYKPSAGERPLWDFPEQDLAHRELAAYLVSEAFGWGVVPRTWLRDGPFGEGMVQLWCEPDPGQNAVELVPAELEPAAGRRRVFEAIGEEELPVALLHEDSPALRRMAVFDIVVNNADRKGAHILEMPDGHRFGVDHGLTFHTEHRLRTVLWGWLGEPLDAEELAGVQRVRTALSGALGTTLAELLNPFELEMFDSRCELLLSEGCFPAPQGYMPAVPWPLI